MNASPLLVWISGPNDPASNMAIDETLLVTAADHAAAVLRFYGWTQPAATFGYFQHIAEVETRTTLRPLVRRPTGGGIVPHDRDWTYSLTVPPNHPWYRLHAVESYRTMHAWVIRGLARIGVTSELAPCCRKEIPGACFEGYEQFDVLRLGRKIAGAAQRRNRSGLLIQGSVQPPNPSSRPDWEQALIAETPDAFFAGTAPFDAIDGIRGIAEALARTRYGTDEYNRRR